MVSLTAEPSFGRYLLPSVYNYAFRRDRERLPYTLAHRLRHGLVGHFKSSGTRGELIMVHFVQDGKPWQPQQLTSYLVAACGAPFPHHRLAWDSSLDQTDPVQLHRFHLGFRTSTFGTQGGHYLQRWTKERGNRNVRACRPGRFPTLRCHTRPCRRPHGKPNFQISAPPRRTECQVRGHKRVFRQPRRRTLQGGAWPTKSRVECAQTAPAPPTGMLRRPVCRPSSRTCTCSHSLQVSADEQHLCDKDRQSAAKRFNCQLAAKRSAGDGWTPKNCSAVAGRQAVTRKATLALRSRVYFCRECWTSSREEDD